MKRSLRVATIFTGTVAAATALTPAADAAAATPTAHNCGVNQSWMFHMYYAPNQRHPTPACVGSGTGLVWIGTGKQFASICGGQYSGSFFYHVPGTDISGFSDFSPGNLPVKFRQQDSIIWVSLTRHFSDDAHFSDRC